MNDLPTQILKEAKLYYQANVKAQNRIFLNFLCKCQGNESKTHFPLIFYETVRLYLIEIVTWPGLIGILD